MRVYPTLATVPHHTHHTPHTSQHTAHSTQHTACCSSPLFSHLVVVETKRLRVVLTAHVDDDVQFREHLVSSRWVPGRLVEWLVEWGMGSGWWGVGDGVKICGGYCRT